MTDILGTPIHKGNFVVLRGENLSALTVGIVVDAYKDNVTDKNKLRIITATNWGFAHGWKTISSPATFAPPQVCVVLGVKEGARKKLEEAYKIYWEHRKERP